MIKNLSVSRRDVDSVPGLGKSPGGGHDDPSFFCKRLDFLC